ncbi:hypothetical protein D3C85_1551130 [compost metagenome]
MLDKLIPQLDQFSQSVTLRAGLNFRRNIELLSKLCQHQSIDLVGLGQLTHGFGVIMRALGINANDVKPLHAQGCKNRFFIAPAGLQHDPSNLKLVQARNKLRAPLRVVF